MAILKNTRNGKLLVRLRIARVALAIVGITLTAGCGGGQADAGGDADAGLPKSPEESYATVMKALFAGESQRVCPFMTPDAAEAFVNQMRRWKNASGTTCEGVIDSFASKQTGPPPEPRGVTMYGPVEYPNENFAELGLCGRNANGDAMTNFTGVTWKKQDGGWIITDIDMIGGCGG
ncbi:MULTISPECIES: hypothetical protein [unclassified Micromonospora]|uniref:hypothetical protein n=1 Tax=unclassified Micromonospora TaxID=2617518 RepID=UPI0033328518